MHMHFALPVCWVFSAVAICDLHAHFYCRQPLSLSSTLLCSELMTAGLQHQEKLGNTGERCTVRMGRKHKRIGCAGRPLSPGPCPNVGIYADICTSYCQYRCAEWSAVAMCELHAYTLMPTASVTVIYTCILYLCI